MSEGNGSPIRDATTTDMWETMCKDCRAEMAAAEGGVGGAPTGRDVAASRKQHRGRPGKFASPQASAQARPRTSAEFMYSGDWAARVLERGGSRSDRCPACRQKHRQDISAYTVAYIDVKAIGSVPDPTNPSGPLGGLGPLPSSHIPKPGGFDLAELKVGLVDQDIVELLEGLELRQVAILEAGTGTGKSTFAPFRLMKPPFRPMRQDGSEPFMPTRRGPIVVTEPRVPATTGVAQFVGETLCFGHSQCKAHIGPGFPVGYQIKGDKNWDDACQLIYVTDGTMINWVREGRLATIGTVIVDEAHERSENIDLILTLLRDQLPRYPHLRVIIASATIDKDFFVEYFGGVEKVHYQHVAAVKGIGYGVPLFPDLEVTEEIIAGGLRDDPLVGSFDPWPAASDGGEDLRSHTRELIGLRSAEQISDDDWVKRMPTAVADQAIRLLNGTEDGDILAFLPTTTMIEDAVRSINEGLRSGGVEASVYPLLSTVADNIKQKALAPSRPGKRKVVVSSNLAETSLTVSGVRYVIDSGLICQSEWDPEIAHQSLPVKFHSQSGARQRWGRVGRDAPGWVFPLYTRAQFAAMPRSTPAGSTRTNLEQFVIKLKSAGVDRPEDVALPGNFSHENWEPDDDGKRVARVFGDELRRAQRSLVVNGAIDADGHLTALGRELDRFSGAPEHALAIMFADRLACVPEVGTAVSILGSGRLVGPRALLRFDRDWPPAWRVQATLCHRGLAVGCLDDLDLVLRIRAAWERAADRSAWARRWWVSEEVLTAANNEVMVLVEALSPAMKEEASRPIELDLVRRARAVLSRSLAGLTYLPAEEPMTWRLEIDPDSAPASLSRNQLVPVEGALIALSRFRPRARPGGALPGPVIQGLVSAYPWARNGEPDPFKLLIRTAKELRDHPDGSLGSLLDDVRARVPIGAVVSTGAMDSSAARRRIHLIHPPPDVGTDLPNLDEEDDTEEDDSGQVTIRRGRRSSDDETSFTVGPPRADAETPEEEALAALLDVRVMEHNDPILSGPFLSG